MASVADVLHHLVRHAPGLGAEVRRQFAEAIDAEPGLHTDHDPSPARAQAMAEAQAAAGGQAGPGFGPGRDPAA